MVCEDARNPLVRRLISHDGSVIMAEQFSISRSHGIIKEDVFHAPGGAMIKTHL